MKAVKGDRIVVDSAKVGSAQRSGEVVEVVIGITSEHYLVRWSDGHETVFFPSPNARVVPPASSS